MHHRLLRFHALVFTGRGLWTEELLAFIMALVIFVSPTSAIVRLTDRSLMTNSAVPGATTSYTVSFRYTTPADVGSVDMLFCEDPIPYMPCVTPPGLDVAGAILSNQSGETGFAITTQTVNHIVLSRSPTMPSVAGLSSYTFDNIKNPTNIGAFAIRLTTHLATDASDQQIDVGSVRGQMTNSIVIETQVPPMLIFCMAESVADNCTTTNNNFFTDMGDLGADSTLTAQSQMAVGTNATGGFVITANGSPPAAGTNAISAPTVPTASVQGSNQFGINLVANNEPIVGSDPEGTWANAVASPDYSVPNKYKYVDGDTVAFSPNVSLMKKFTVSYILNSSPNLRAGVYSTTITFIASGRF